MSEQPIVGMSEGSLETPLDPELLRGVPLKVCLQGFGKHWKRTVGSGSSESGSVTLGETFRLSQKTDELDYFFSHDWETSRLLKWLSLLVMFNSHAAAIAMLIVTSLLVVLACYGSIPELVWPLLPLLSMITYLVFFVFWQQLRSLWCKPCLVFLDRLCIAQHDRALKEQGIRGLGCFLAKSRNLTILWSGRYFSRLWCLYELASYLKDETVKDQRNIQILPVDLCLLLLISTIQAVVWLCVIFISWAFSIWWMTEHPILFNLLGRGGGVFIPVAVYMALGCMTRLYQLPQQLHHFRVQDAKCFCCSNDHKHPETGQELQCDRMLVFNALEKWFSSKRNSSTRDSCRSSQDWMDRFNLMVRQKLSHRIAHTVGRGLPPFKYALSTVCVAPFPFMSYFIPATLAQTLVEYHDEMEWAEYEKDETEWAEYEQDESLKNEWDFMEEAGSVVSFWIDHLMEIVVPSLYGILTLILILQACRLVFYLFQRCNVSTSILLSPWRRASVTLVVSPILWIILVYGVWVPLIGEYDVHLEIAVPIRASLYVVYWCVVLAFFFLPQLECSQTQEDPGLDANVIGVMSGPEARGHDGDIGEYNLDLQEELVSVRF